jgi:hypothetical protein
MHVNLPDNAEAAPHHAARGAARLFQLTMGDPPTPWPIYLLRQGLLLLVDGIDARYGQARAVKGDAVRTTESHSRTAGDRNASPQGN